jgi:hypothetical protein
MQITSSTCSKLTDGPPTPDSARPLHRQLTLPVAARPRAEGRAGEASTPGQGRAQLPAVLPEAAIHSHTHVDRWCSQAPDPPRVISCGGLQRRPARSFILLMRVGGRLRQRRADVRSGPKYEAEACKERKGRGSCRHTEEAVGVAVARTSCGPAPMTPGARVHPTRPRPSRLLRRWGGNRRGLSVTPAVWVRPYTSAKTAETAVWAGPLVR